MDIERTIVIASTFTAEPVRDSVQFWLERMQMPGRVSFAPQNQLIQTLLDPASSFNSNTGGINVGLLRWEDLDRSQAVEDDRPLNDLFDAVRACAKTATVPHVLITCPPSPVLSPSKHQLYARWSDRLAGEFAASPSISVVTSAELQTLHPAVSIHDFYGDELAAIPYSQAMFAAIGTMIARKYHALTTDPYKVIVVDCDGTLWGGVCGEDGPHGVQLDREHLAVQELLVSQAEQGVLVCLCSKNNEEDVKSVFRERADMRLRWEHLSSSRINWAPKAENLVSIADELGLSVDHFIFLDDSPVECESMRQLLPNVLPLHLSPGQRESSLWLRRIWAFDRPPATNEDRKRIGFYKQDREREYSRLRSTSLQDFLAGLELSVAYLPLEANLSRASQLTFRVNQFNLTSIGRTEAELLSLLRGKRLRGFAVEARDRFGDYGVVGLVLYSAASAELQVDTFLLSCRALGRGVEHQIVARLGAIAKELSLNGVTLRLIPGAKNKPAQDFLETDFGAYRHQELGHLEYRVSLDAALAAFYRPKMGRDTEAVAVASTVADQPLKIAPRSRIACAAAEMDTADRILEAVEAWRQRPSFDREGFFLSPETDLERMLAAIWADVLGVENIGARDNFFELGGDSLAMVRVIIQLHNLTGVELPIQSFFENPTVQGLAIALAEHFPATIP